MKTGTLVISLDFELIWGVFDHVDINNKKEYFDNTLNVIPKIIENFVNNDVKATWATVGMLFNDNWEEWHYNIPVNKPTYANIKLDPYAYGKANKNLGLDRFFFAPKIINDLQNAAGQEIGTHTYSHYYCLEQGQTKEQFEADLDLVVKLGNKFKIPLKSLVFPRNQFNQEYLESCVNRNILTVRSNPNIWYWDTLKPQTIAHKIFRTGDSYLNLGAKSYQKNSINLNLPSSQPASRFLRPQSKYNLLNSLRLIRIKEEIINAARNGEVYHLWWHPHNFGIDPQGAIKALQSILEVYDHCKSTYGMESKTMLEIHNDLL